MRSYMYSADAHPDRVVAGKTVRGKNRLYYGGGALVYYGQSMDEMAGRFLSSIRDELTNDLDDFVRIRAAGATMDGGSILLPSPPDPHLPYLAAGLVRRGGRYLGDEIVMIDPILHQAHGLPLPLLLDTDDVLLMPDLGRSPTRKVKWEKDPEGARTNRRPVRLEEIGGTPAEPRPVRWIAFPTYRPGGPTEIVPMGKAEAVFGLVQAMLNMEIWGDRGLVFARELMEKVRVARLLIGSMEEAAEALTDWAGTG